MDYEFYPKRVGPSDEQGFRHEDARGSLDFVTFALLYTARVRQMLFAAGGRTQRSHRHVSGAW